MKLDYCHETPAGRDCLVCGLEGDWERPVVSIDDWYPKPCPPEPEPQPVPVFYTWQRIMYLLIAGFLLFWVLCRVL